MNSQVEQVNTMPNGGSLDMQNVAMLGASLAGMGLEAMEVQGLLASVHRVSLQTAVNSMSDVLEKVSKIQRSKITDIVTRISMLPSMYGYVNKLAVLNIINTSLSTPPRQQ